MRIKLLSTGEVADKSRFDAQSLIDLGIAVPCEDPRPKPTREVRFAVTSSLTGQPCIAATEWLLVGWQA